MRIILCAIFAFDKSSEFYAVPLLFHQKEAISHLIKRKTWAQRSLEHALLSHLDQTSPRPTEIHDQQNNRSGEDGRPHRQQKNRRPGLAKSWVLIYPQVYSAKCGCKIINVLAVGRLRTQA